MGTGRDDLLVFLDRPRLCVAGLAVLAISVAIGLGAGPIGYLGVPVAIVILIRGVDPRPQATLTDEGVTFGGLLKSAWGRDVHVRWSEVQKVTLVADQLGGPPHLTESTPFVPRRLSRFTTRWAPPGKVDVTTADGRRLSVYPPGRGLTLGDIERELETRVPRSR